MPILEGIYVYRGNYPENCVGCKYRVIASKVLDIPSYQHKVVVRGLDGPDKDRSFSCTVSYFWARFVKA